MSILKSIMEEKKAKSSKKIFLESIAFSSGLGIISLSNQYDIGASKAEYPEQSTILAKMQVYKFVKETQLKENEEFEDYAEFVDSLVDEYEQDSKWFEDELADGGDPPDSYLPDYRLEDKLHYYEDMLSKFGKTVRDVTNDVIAKYSQTYNVHEDAE